MENMDTDVVLLEAANDESLELNDRNPTADEETVKTNVEPNKKRNVRHPLPKLNVDRLKGVRGLVILEDWFKDLNFQGKHHEKEDLDAVMCRLEQWTHRLFPKFTFDDALNRVEKLGHKSQISNYVKRIRMNLLDLDDEKATENVVAENTDTSAMDLVGAPSPETIDKFDDQVVLTEAQRENMVRNRLLAEERKMARMKMITEREQNSL